MTATKKTVAQQLAERIATHEHVLKARATGNRIIVVFPRERGGWSYMTVPQAKRLAERLGV